jgi:hypothetical protein
VNLKKLRLNDLLKIPSNEHFSSAAQSFDEVTTFIKNYKREFFCETNIYFIEAISIIETTASKNAIVAKLLTNYNLVN